MSNRNLGEYIKTCESYYLKPGFLYVTERPAAIKTVLGSCVSVCVYDSKLKFGGMNHFLLPDAPISERTSRYGKPAVLALLYTFLEFGSNQGDLVAQVVGGAGMAGHEDSIVIGQSNVKIARDVLDKFGIPVRSADVGGTLGRKVVYLSELDQLMVIKLEKIRAMDFYDYTDRRRNEYERNG